eukprot:g14312.t1
MSTPSGDEAVVVSTNGAAGDPPADNAAAGAGDAAVGADDNMDVEVSDAPATGSSAPVPPISCVQALDATITSMSQIINIDMRKLEDGTIQELPPRTIQLMDRMFDAFDRRNATTKFNAGQGSGSSPTGARGTGGNTGGNKGGGGNSKGGRAAKAGRGGRDRSDADRPRCTYDGCKKPLGHTYDTCYQRLKVEDPDAYRDLMSNKKARKNKDD